MSQEPVGLIGLGLLGSAIAQRILESGRPVTGFDTDPRRCKALNQSGGESCAVAGDVMRECATVILSLPTSPIVLSVLRESAASLGSRHTVIDTTTGDPGDVAAIAELLAEQGAQYLEAKVAGSSQQTRRGDAAILLAGEEEAVRAQRQLLESISTQIFYLGPIGAATRFKLVHNLILGLHRAVLAEGLHFAEALGFSAAETVEILRHTPATSRAMDSKGQKMAAADYSPQATLSQHLKDVRLILDEATRLNAPAPLSVVHRELLERAEQLGYGTQDNSAVIEAYRQLP